jgi:hypothetical protein
MIPLKKIRYIISNNPQAMLRAAALRASRLLLEKEQNAMVHVLTKDQSQPCPQRYLSFAHVPKKVYVHVVTKS